MKQIPNIVITLEGGIIQNIDSDLPVKVIVLDFDDSTIHVSEETQFTSVDGEKQSAIVTVWNEDETTAHPEVSKHIFEQLDK